MVTEIIELKDSDELIGIDENFKLTAGPGSGKTRFLINHINNVSKTSDKLKNGRKIACITHTNVAVDEIKKRLKNSINEVEVNTIHSFLYKQIVKPYLWTIANDFHIDLSSLSSIKKCFPSYSLLPKSYYWVLKQHGTEKILNLLQNLNWTLDSFNNPIIEYQEFIQIPYDFLTEYKQNCWKKGLLSPEDILFFSYHILIKNQNILNLLKIKFPYIFLDEFQDTSLFQCEIVKLLANNGITIGIIGDYAQSIYKFQGAELELFTNFEIDIELQEYILKNNHRSTKNIINILNNIRKDDFEQKCYKKEDNSNIKPTIIVGNRIKAYKKSKEILSTSNFYSLSYKTIEINSLKFELSHDNEFKYLSEELLNKIFDKDTYHRKMIIKYTILSLESFRIGKIKDALKYMEFGYKKYEFDKYLCLKNLYRLNSQYETFANLSITDFYNKFIYGYDNVQLEIRNHKVTEYYDNYTYNDFALNLSKNYISSKFRTIHSCKGKEFDSIMLFIPLEKNLDFLLEPDILNMEEHRVYYVALSRAMENIILNVPTLNENNAHSLKEIGFEIIYVDETWILLFGLIALNTCWYNLLLIKSLWVFKLSFKKKSSQYIETKIKFKNTW